MNISFFCTSEWIKLDVPLQVWEGQTADGRVGSVLITRLLHNKILFYANNYLRCYLNYLSPDTINGIFSFAGLILFILGIWFAVTRRNRLILGIALLAPVFPLFLYPKFRISTDIYFLMTAVVGIYGLYGFVRILRNLLRAVN